MDKTFREIKGWLTASEAAAIHEFCLVRAGSISTICEIGTYEGKSASILRHYGTLYCLDIGGHMEIAATNLSIDTYMISLIKGSSEWVPYIKPDLVYIDADHSHSKISEDLENCKDVPYILGHDFHIKDVRGAAKIWAATNGLEVRPYRGTLWFIENLAKLPVPGEIRITA